MDLLAADVIRSSLVSGCILSVFQIAYGDFEKWTNSEGKVAELNLVDVTKSNEVVTAEFETKAGRRMLLKLDQLSEADRQRVQAWKPERQVRAKFKAAKNDVVDGRNRTRFTFEIQSKGLLDLIFEEEQGVIHPGKPEVLRCNLDGKPVKFESCSAWLERDPFEGPKDEDPFAGGKQPVPNVDGAGELDVFIEGGPADLRADDCDFQAKLYYEHVSVPKEIKGEIEVSKKLDDLKFQQLGQFKVALKPWALSDSRKETEAQALEKNGADGYSLEVQEDGNHRFIIAENVVVNGKQEDAFGFEGKGKKFEVVIRYWSVVRRLPFLVEKAAVDKGGSK